MRFSILATPKLAVRWAAGCVCSCALLASGALGTELPTLLASTWGDLRDRSRMAFRPCGRRRRIHHGVDTAGSAQTRRISSSASR